MRDRLLGSRISDTHFPHVLMRTPLYTLAFSGDTFPLEFKLLGDDDFFEIDPDDGFSGANKFPPLFALRDCECAFSTIPAYSPKSQFRSHHFLNSYCQTSQLSTTSAMPMQQSTQPKSPISRSSKTSNLNSRNRV